jgi:hypothetical protein
MPRDTNGNYTLPAGNPVVPDTVIDPSWANPTMSDLGAEITNSLDRQGRGGMLAPFRFVDGTAVAPGMTFTNEPTSGFFRAAASNVQVSIAGVPRMRWTATGTEFWNGTAWVSLDSLAPASGAVTIDGAQTITGLKTFKATTGGSFIDVEKNLATVQAGLRYRREDGNQRWQTGLTGTSDDNFFLGRFSPTGVFQDSPILVSSATGQATFSVAINGSVLGSAATLTTPRNINGTAFNGGANITTLSWGTSRTLTIGATGKPVDGSGNVSWSLAEIGAVAAGTTVNLTGDQTVAGIKTFSNTLVAPTVQTPTILPSAANLRLQAASGFDVRIEINTNVKLQAQVENTSDFTTAAKVRHADGTLYDVGLNVMPVLAANSSRTLARSDVGKILETSSGTVALTTPASGDTTVPVGAVINGLRSGGTGLTVVAGSGVTLQWFNGSGTIGTGTRTIAVAGVYTLQKVSSTVWRIWGAGIT